MGQSFTAWSATELAILSDHAGKLTSIEIGKIIGPDGVRKMAKKLGLPSWVAPVSQNSRPTPQGERVRTPKAVEPTPEPPAKPVEPEKPTVSYAYDVCPSCRHKVVSWDDHLEKLGQFRCRRDAA